MIDIHTHILPQVDDGSPDMDKSMEMLKVEEAEGVTDIVLTPHLRREYNTSLDELKSAFDRLVKEKEKNKIKVNLYLGQEVFYFHKAYDCVGKNIMTINNGKYILLEFHYTSYCDISEVAFEFIQKGYIPIIAHAERYRYLRLEDVEEIKDMGGLISVNAESIIASSGRIKKFVKICLKNNFIDVVTSDNHYGKEICLEKARKFIKKKYGEKRAQELFEINPKKVIEG
ncbi:MAG: hypothetical protein MJ066_03410 [Clostridia bacterium]|nr:hypothetical protein [Clostridia bacterium]